MRILNQNTYQKERVQRKKNVLETNAGTRSKY
jgi:hypothetical protein